MPTKGGLDGCLGVATNGEGVGRVGELIHHLSLTLPTQLTALPSLILTVLLRHLSKCHSALELLHGDEDLSVLLAEDVADLNLGVSRAAAGITLRLLGGDWGSALDVFWWGHFYSFLINVVI